MVTVLGLDIGGANTKAAYMRTRNGSVEELRTAHEYFPFWKKDSLEIVNMLCSIMDKLVGSEPLECVCVTMTAELSDVYKTKREGVNHILDCITKAFTGIQMLVLDTDGNLRSIDSARSEPLKVAAANWAATGWMVAQKIQNGVVVDVGSTTTSIIPIVEGKVAVAGKNDLDKLINGELVYTGSLRTNIAAIVKSVSLKGGIARVSSELFAQSGDIHLLLCNIREADYTAETPDGKGKTGREACSRLARVVCADTEMLTEQEILQIAKQVYAKQVEQIAEGLAQVYSRLKPGAKKTVPVVLTGLGSNFLARKAAEELGITKILGLDKWMPKEAVFASPATGVALMAATKLEGRLLTWTP
jgi:hypothetical protein